MRVFLLVSTVLLMGCQTPMQTGSQCVVEPGFLPMEATFSWLGEPRIHVQDPTGYISPLAVRALEQGVVAQLENQGLSYQEAAPIAPDVEIELTLRTRRELVTYQTDSVVCAHTDCWERVGSSADMRMESRTIGFLAADVFHDGELIWRGWVETTLLPKDRDRADEVIARVLPELFSTFPP